MASSINRPAAQPWLDAWIDAIAPRPCGRGAPTQAA